MRNPREIYYIAFAVILILTGVGLFVWTNHNKNEEIRYYIQDN